jgi:hypothetical protein
MKISAITTREQLEGAKTLGLLSEKEVKQVEERLAKIEAKPTVQNIQPVETVLGGGTSWKGESYRTGFFTKVNEGKKGPWVSTFFRLGYKAFCYAQTEDLEIVAEALITHIEVLRAQGFKFKPAKR